MSGVSIIVMIIIITLVWGGFAFALKSAISKESKKKNK